MHSISNSHWTKGDPRGDLHAYKDIRHQDQKIPEPFMELLYNPLQGVDNHFIKIGLWSSWHTMRGSRGGGGGLGHKRTMARTLI